MLIALNDDVAVDPKKVVGVWAANSGDEKAVKVSMESDDEDIYLIPNTTVAEVTAKINAAIENEILLRGAK